MTVIYCTSAPIGIAIGIGAQNTYNPNSAKANYIQGTFDSVSAGIILYVAFVQMLAVEFSKDVRRVPRWWRKTMLFVCMWFGALVMCIIGNWL